MRLNMSDMEKDATNDERLVQNNDDDDDDDDDDDSVVAFAALDLTGVNFDAVDADDVEETEGVAETTTTTTTNTDHAQDNLLDKIQEAIVFHEDDALESIMTTMLMMTTTTTTKHDHEDVNDADGDHTSLSMKTKEWIALLQKGKYIALLRQANLPRPILSPSTHGSSSSSSSSSSSGSRSTTTNAITTTPMTITSQLQEWFKTQVSNQNDHTTEETEHEIRFQCQMIGIAALKLFLQLNYTGPSLEQAAKSSLKNNKQNRDEYEKEKDDYHDILYPYQQQQEEDNTTATHDTTTRMASTTTITTAKTTGPSQRFHNQVLSELVIEGEWPIQVCQIPYYLLLARTLLHDLMESSTTTSTTSTTTTSSMTMTIWSLRAAVAHSRLFIWTETSPTLWKELKLGFQTVLMHYCSHIDVNHHYNNNNDTHNHNKNDMDRARAATLVLEYGLAHHFMERPGKGQLYFWKAMEYSGLQVQLTGALGKRTKYQQDAIAQLLVHAVSAAKTKTKNHNNGDGEHKANKQETKSKPAWGITHSEDEILLEYVQFEESTATGTTTTDEGTTNISSNDDTTTPSILDNQKIPITVLDQCILLALCLTVKNTNPSQEDGTGDVLTGEEMGAYLARVLQDCQDWMVYATALLERAWLEFHSSHSRERSLLQLQALSDQHSNRLTLTQSTFAAVSISSTSESEPQDEQNNNKNTSSSAPAQERLRHVQTIVYPPRWHCIRDLAERYASMGIVTSAAELFLQIELWDSVVECYKRAGKERLAKEIVEQQLKLQETPRMYVALGDLTHDPQQYHKAIALSNGRFSNAYIALGKYYFDLASNQPVLIREEEKEAESPPGRSNLEQSALYYRQAVALRPLAPHVWFRLGTICMKLQDWDGALTAFSKVVLLEPEESDAWANVAAVHMHEKHPEEAYPALKESLKYNRTNWRIWINQLYTCIDLNKYDEAIQACHVVLDLKQTHSGVVFESEEKCIKAIVGKTLALDRTLDTTKRTLSRVHQLLDRLSSSNGGSGVGTAASSSWIWECLAIFHEAVGMDEKVLDNLVKEYRALQLVHGWEKDPHQLMKVTAVISQICHFYKTSQTKENIIKGRYLVRGALQKIKTAYHNDELYGNNASSKLPKEQVEKLEKLLQQFTESVEP